MAKHVIEHELLRTAGFNVISNGEAEIAAPNVDQKLTLVADKTIDIDILNNRLHFSVKVPYFSTVQW